MDFHYSYGEEFFPNININIQAAMYGPRQLLYSLVLPTRVRRRRVRVMKPKCLRALTTPPLTPPLT